MCEPHYIRIMRRAQRCFLLMALVTAGASRPLAIRHDLGDSHVVITCKKLLAQQYFDQGMRWYWAFNFPEAVTAFRAAQAADSTCAMCFWAEGLALGANINWANTVPGDKHADGTFDAPRAVPLAHAAAVHAASLLNASSSRVGVTSPCRRA